MYDNYCTGNLRIPSTDECEKSTRSLIFGTALKIRFKLGQHHRNVNGAPSRRSLEINFLAAAFILTFNPIFADKNVWRFKFFDKICVHLAKLAVHERAWYEAIWNITNIAFDCPCFIMMFLKFLYPYVWNDCTFWWIESRRRRRQWSQSSPRRWR